MPVTDLHFRGKKKNAILSKILKFFNSRLAVSLVGRLGAYFALLRDSCHIILGFAVASVANGAKYYVSK